MLDVREGASARIMIMRRIFLILAVVLTSLSCSIDIPYTVTLRIADEHPFEILASEDMWYILKYFDGKGIVERYIPASERTIENVPVYTGGLRPFILIPLGTLGPIGGFYEPGGGEYIELKSEYGSFAEMLIGASAESDASNCKYSSVPKSILVRSIKSLGSSITFNLVRIAKLGNIAGIIEWNQ